MWRYSTLKWLHSCKAQTSEQICCPFVCRDCSLCFCHENRYDALVSLNAPRLLHKMHQIENSPQNSSNNYTCAFPVMLAFIQTSIYVVYFPIIWALVLCLLLHRSTYVYGGRDGE